MKKLLLAFLSLSACFGAWSQQPTPDLFRLPNQPINPGKLIPEITETQKPTRSGENTNWFGYCSGYNDCLKFPLAGTYVVEEAIMIPSEFSQNWKGNKITTVNIGYGESSNLKILLYITKSLDGEPVYMQETTLKEAGGWNEVVLDTPYTIDGDEFFIGYQTEARGLYDAPLGIDKIPNTWGLGDFYGVNGEYENLGSTNGNVCIRFLMEGPVKPELDALTDLMFNNDLLAADEPFDLNISVLNLGAQPLTGADLACTIAGKPVGNLEVSLVSGYGDVIPFGTLGMIKVSGTIPEGVYGSRLPLVVTLNSIIAENGSIPFSNQQFTANVVVTGQTFPKKFVVEEFTGTWCGWCPRGIVGMEYMKANYGDQGFIGIAGHNGDAMALANYQEAINQYGGGSFPAASINRSIYPVSPGKLSLEMYFTELQGTTTTINVEVEAEYSSDKSAIEATATLISAVDLNDVNYSLCFVLTEDHVGPYNQKNDFAGGSGEEGMAEWEAAGASVKTYYDEVARVVMDPYGIPNSVPKKIKNMVPATYKVDLPTSKVTNVQNCHVIAMLLDNTTGEILNAAQVAIGDAGVEGIETEEFNGYNVYNLQGVKVLHTYEASEVGNLPKGIYIVNGKKVLVK